MSEPASRVPVVAIAGNPNTGKTSLFNALTGLSAKVGNYPGVTVERRSGRPFADLVEPAVLQACLEEDYLRWSPEGRLVATTEGRLRLDAMLPALLR